MNILNEYFIRKIYLKKKKILILNDQGNYNSEYFRN